MGNQACTPLFLDIRTSAEYNRQGHIQGAILIETPLPPLSSAQVSDLRIKLWDTVSEIPRNCPMYVYCKRGIRSSIAEIILKEEFGFSNVTNLGGIENPSFMYPLI